MKMPRVTVILTSFNHAKYLGDAIDSVLNQSFSDFELVILDDASTDDSWWLINQYRDPRIIAVRSDMPSEVTWRTNDIISRTANGEYIAIHHSDDIWELDKLQKQVEMLDRNAALAAVFTNASPIREDGSLLGDESHFYFRIFDQKNRSRHQWLRHFFSQGNALCHPSVLIRKSAFDERGLYKPWLRQIDDFEMWIRLLMRYEIHVIPEKLVRFRVRDNEVQVSGNSRGSRIRNAYEYHHALSNFKEIDDFEDLCGIFPEARKYYRQTGVDLLFILGLVAIEVTERSFVHLFALNLIQDAIADPLRAASLKRNYDFSVVDLHELTGQYDVFSLEEVATVSRNLLERDAHIRSVESRLAEAAEQIFNFDRGIAERDTLILAIDQELSEKKTRVAQLTQELLVRDADISHLHRVAADWDAVILRLDQDLSQQREHVANLNQEVASRDSHLVNVSRAAAGTDHALRHQLEDREAEVVRLDREISVRDAELSRREAKMDELERSSRTHLHTIEELRASTSWRLTKPVRFVGRLSRKGWAAMAGTQGGARTASHPHGIEGAESVEARRAAPLSLDLDTSDEMLRNAPTAPVAETVEHAHAWSVSEVALRGEAESNFSAGFYLDNYPDVREAGLDPYDHFIRHGRAEGRVGIPYKVVLNDGEVGFDPSKKTILLVSHEASRSGAPILTLNIAGHLKRKFNVVILLLGDGPLFPIFRQVAMQIAGPAPIRSSPVQADYVIAELCALHRFEYAIVNSIECRAVLRGLTRMSVPSVTLIHEFAAYTRPRDAFQFAMQWSMEVVFSARITQENAISEHPELGNKISHVIPQGRCETLPFYVDEVTQAAEKDRIARFLRPKGQSSETVVIIGAGAVQYRKGVDLFLECAAHVVRELGDGCRFVWVGTGYDPERDVGYSVYLAEQLRRSGLQKHVAFMHETVFIDDVYAAADILVLSSRLDPLPNVAIDAMSCSLPVVCFAESTGIADALTEGGMARECIAPYHDSAAMAQLVLDLARSREDRLRVGGRLKEIVKEQFDMPHYVERLEKIAAQATRRLVSEIESSRIIADAKLLEPSFFFRAPQVGKSMEELVRHGYVRSWAAGLDLRKPYPGFHPGIYLERARIQQAEGVDPFALFIKNGQPDGPWKFEVIGSGDEVVELPNAVRAALHVHAYYPEMIADIFAVLASNVVRPDLFISVPDERSADIVQQSAAACGLSLMELRVVPNIGRDLGPLLAAFGDVLLGNYDFVGHIHTKKSADVEDRSMGERWYEFLIQNLLGGKTRMADIILGRMSADPSIGLVFPDDPHVVGWGANVPYAEALRPRLGIESLPGQIAFPVGSMFWARADAIRPLFELKLGWDDFPAEPLPYDGSMLHAIERLLPLIVEAQSMRLAVTHVVGVTR